MTRDNEHVKIVDATETLLAILVYPDGRVSLNCRAKTEDGGVDHAWVVETLRRLILEEEKNVR